MYWESSKGFVDFVVFFIFMKFVEEIEVLFMLDKFCRMKLLLS